jgi:manganese transport protein
MDPGNWATDLAGGSAFGYTLLSVVLLSSLFAMLLQALSVRLGIATGRDLAQACRDRFPRPAVIALWLAAELAIIACDLAEVIGAAIALQLLFGLPLVAGVLVTTADVLLILGLQRSGMRLIEAIVIALLAVIAGCFAVNLWLAQPDFGAAARGLVPGATVLRDPAMLYVAIGILGATVMPHNLYLHSAIVRPQGGGWTPERRADAVRWATLDSTTALSLAFFVNAAILMLAAAAFHAHGLTRVAEIGDAYRLLAPALGTGLASTLFAVALLASGQNSTLTATMAGQVVMEGFLGLRLRPWVRRLLTRGLALIPAVVVAVLYGETGTAQLLVLSQVVLSMQLPFAVIPLVVFTSDRRLMGALAIGRPAAALAWGVAAVIVALNAKLLWDVVTA